MNFNRTIALRDSGERLNSENNRPFLSCFDPHYESETKLVFIHVKTKLIFDMKSFALSLAFMMTLALNDIGNRTDHSTGSVDVLTAIT